MDNDNRRGKEVGEPSLADANARLKEKVMALEREKKQLAATLEERERDLKEAKIMAEERKELIAEIRSAAARTGQGFGRRKTPPNGAWESRKVQTPTGRGRPQRDGIYPNPH